MVRGIPYDDFNNALDESLIKVNNLEPTEADKDRVLDMIDKIKADSGMNSYQKGKLFEDMIESIVLSTKIFKTIKNKHTSSNEFDILVGLNTNGKILRAKNIIPSWIPDRFLIECKNHKEPVNVGLVGKFYSVMDVSKINLGIFISKEGVTGKDAKHWDDAMAFINKINLKYSESESPKILLDFGINDLETAVKSNINIIETIETRKTQIDLDISGGLMEWINPHENQGQFN